MFKVNNKNTRTTSIHRSVVLIANFEHISHLFASVSIVDFEQLIVRQVSIVYLQVNVRKIQDILLKKKSMKNIITRNNS